VTALDSGPVGPPAVRRRAARRLHRLGSVETLAAVILVAILARDWLSGFVDSAAAAAVATVFISIMVQALPFVVAGALLSAAVGAFVPATVLDRHLPTRPAAAVAAGGGAGVLLPAGTPTAVPAAAAMIRRGVAPGAALAYLLAASAINPIVLISTAVAFPGQPSMVAARFGAGLLVAVIMGWLWLWLRSGQPAWSPAPRAGDPPGRGWPAFWAACRDRVVQAGGFLVIGAFVAAVLTAAVPPRWLEATAAIPVFSAIALALLAVLLSICSEGGAFVAASLSQFSLTARLTFLVVGPVADLRVFSRHVGWFGASFAVRFAPATLVVAIVVSGLLGWVIF
jgi:hypothetical protein